AAHTGVVAARVLDSGRAGINTVFLIASSATLWLGSKSLEQRRGAALAAWLAVTIILGALFLAGQGREWLTLVRANVTVSRDLFGTTFFTLTGFHGLHVLLGLCLLAMLFCLAVARRFKGPTSAAIEAVALYWHFVDAVWIGIYSLIYLWALVG
ncbi:MAG: cytochrome c oxidase subunit I, partial [Bacillati bacterium ANGP1]